MHNIFYFVDSENAMWIKICVVNKLIKLKIKHGQINQILLYKANALLL